MFEYKREADHWVNWSQNYYSNDCKGFMEGSSSADQHHNSRRLRSFNASQTTNSEKRPSSDEEHMV